MFKSAVLLIVSLFLLAACAEPMSNTGKGALIGAAGGALLGQAIGKDTKGTLIGAAAGAAAGGASVTTWTARNRRCATPSPRWRG